MVQYRKLSELTKLENNPRYILDKDMEKLKASIKKFWVLEGRPLILSNRTGELVIIAGNMRYEACKALGIEEVPTELITVEMLEEIVKRHFKETWELITIEQAEKEIIIRDNVSSGEWDMSSLANNWDLEDLAEWWVEGAEWLDDWKQVIVNDPKEEWKGMPSFEQEDLTPLRQIIVSFKNEDDIDSFAQLIGQNITDKTRSIWYPYVEPATFIDKKYDTAE